MRLRRLGLIATVGWLAGCNQAYAEFSHTRKDEVLIKCPRSLTSIPPGYRYGCTIDVLAVADHDRWLVFPFLMEERFKPSQGIALLQVNENDEGVFTCWALKSNEMFAAIPIPARKPLHIKRWELISIQEVEEVTVWLGGELPLSNGETLSAVFKRLKTQSFATDASAEPHEWTAPKGTTITFDPKGLQTIHLNLPKKKNSDKKM